MDPITNPETENHTSKESLYRNWRKNAPYLYNTIYTQSLTWPSLTAQWLPENPINEDEGFAVNKVLYATNTSGQQQDYLIVGKLKFPCLGLKKAKANSKDEDDKGEIGEMLNKKEDKIRVYSMVQHEGQVNRARYNPFRNNIIATKSSTGDVLVYNYFQHSKEGKPQDNSMKLKLVGHEQQGFGLSWNEKREGYLVSSANDGKVLAWDISEVSNKCRQDIAPITSFQGHNCPVNDTNFHKFHSDVFGSCDDQGNIFIWDIRQEKKLSAVSKKFHEGQIYSIDFSRRSEYLFSSGGSDKLVCVWDLRNCSQSLFSLKHHTGSITKVQMSTQNRNLVWSSSQDATMCLWDVSQQSPLKFVHAGHRQSICDFDIHPQDQTKLFSTDQGHQLHLFQAHY